MASSNPTYRETSNKEVLYQLYKQASPDSESLLIAFEKNTLQQLEREPYGPRNDQKDFDVSQVERVINDCMDWSNNSVYSYEYRQQLMEAFTFVNAIGYKLPIFNAKTVKELSNQEISEYFLKIKTGEIFNDLSPFQQQLIALSLIREALYRTTGQMAYSTQLIAIIDCLMHEGNVISNIDTGQGKSLVDMAKAALLWLQSDRVDITTSSVIDAKRDLEAFKPFLNSLALPCGDSIITARSPASALSLKGINISTCSQLSLYKAKIKLEGVELEKESDRISLIANEADYSFLEDQTTYRYALETEESLPERDDWIYSAVNEFVQTDKFKSNKTSEETDINDMITFAYDYAKRHKKNHTVIDVIGYARWLRWINAGILVNYGIEENKDYVISEKPEVVPVRGILRETHVVKLFSTEGNVKTKISQDTTFGNAVTQILIAAKREKYQPFIIPHETSTIISSNNKNLIDSYTIRQNPGMIWGSTATTGSTKERAEIHSKHNIHFSKIPPHQPNILKQKTYFF